MKKIPNILVEIIPQLVWTIQLFVLFFAMNYHTTIFSLYSITVSSTLAFLSLIYILIGVELFIMAFSVIRKKLITKEIQKTGIYEFIRHPLYLAVYVMLIGAGFIFLSWLWYAILLCFIPIWIMVCKIEEYQMTKLHTEYTEYKKQTGMFLPKI